MAKQAKIRAVYRLEQLLLDAIRAEADRYEWSATAVVEKALAAHLKAQGWLDENGYPTQALLDFQASQTKVA